VKETYTVAFVCLGNACRSQMAEGFARAYGKDVMSPCSAGLAPAVAVPFETRRAMMEKNIDISNQFPKPVNLLSDQPVDLVVNMSGLPLRGFSAIRDWEVRDPYGDSEETYRKVRDQIETLVMKLIMELRRKSR
jgi:arsenate reductase (thioredoxin)